MTTKPFAECHTFLMYIISDKLLYNASILPNAAGISLELGTTLSYPLYNMTDYQIAKHSDHVSLFMYSQMK